VHLTPVPTGAPPALPDPIPATAGDTDGGWLYQVLTKLGVHQSPAHTVADLVVRPVELVLIIAVAAFVAYFGRKAIRRYLGRMAQRAARISGSTRAHSRATTMVGLVGNLWRFLVVVVAAAVVLGVIGINLTPILASATIIAVTVGFGAQMIVRDYLTGVLLSLEDQYAIGDTVTIVLPVAQITGVVEDITLRVTRLQTADGTISYIPNGDIREISNLTRGGARAVVDIPVARASAAALEELKLAATAAARTVHDDPHFAEVCTEPPEVLGVVAVDAETCTIRVQLKTSAARRAETERALREAVVGAFADADAGTGTGA
jgi:small conductance mechanosensitive channel